MSHSDLSLSVKSSSTLGSQASIGIRSAKRRTKRHSYLATWCRWSFTKSTTGCLRMTKTSSSLTQGSSLQSRLKRTLRSYSWSWTSFIKRVARFQWLLRVDNLGTSFRWVSTILTVLLKSWFRQIKIWREGSHIMTIKATSVPSPSLASSVKVKRRSVLNLSLSAHGPIL